MHTAAALDALHDPDLRPRPPQPGSQADHLTCAGLALAAAMRVSPPGLTVRDTWIRPADGRIALDVGDYFHAELLATRLQLPAALRITELDGGWLAKRWHGRFADHPFEIVHLFRPAASALVGTCRTCGRIQDRAPGACDCYAAATSDLRRRVVALRVARTRIGDDQ